MFPSRLTKIQLLLHNAGHPYADAQGCDSFIMGMGERHLRLFTRQVAMYESTWTALIFINLCDGQCSAFLIEVDETEIDCSSKSHTLLESSV